MKSLIGRYGRWLGPYAALWITLVFGGFLVIALALLGAEVYQSVVAQDGVAGLDRPALEMAKQYRNPGLDAAVTAFTNIGGGIGMPILASILVARLIYVSRSWRPLILVGGAAAVSITATTVSKTLLGRVRPDHIDAVPPFEFSPSFPSGHTLNTTVVIGVVVYLMCLQADRTWIRISVITAGAVFIIAMGLSRVFLGHHWMTDVIAAWLLGLAWLGMVILAHRLFHVIRRREHAGPAPTFEHPAHLTAKEPHHRVEAQDSDTPRQEAPGTGGSHGSRGGDPASG
ncbi:phosphatase PAP2 family protein [Arthrobacter sp. ISL-5]|uniref:phosphatase PAP2 family protein n=1 Tax=Arthrobacter sp. ISL-5 TaxID=2819111 RepID=UPI001BE52CE2|nr:phosphatase PAP2 family protein [Arthrobacter sp. ISL-5]MBT2551528.1 phosphatase PAP2 family protein [Arthrobacter sp. ISL-5]